MFRDLVYLFAALALALVPTLLVLGWLYAPRYRDLVRRLFVGRAAILPLPSYRMPFAFAATAFCWMVAMLFMANRAMAADASPAAFVVDWSPLVNKLIELVVVALAAVFTAAVHRGTKVLQDMHVINAAQLHMASLDDAMTQAAGWVSAQLEAIADPEMKIAMKSALLAKAAQMAAAQAPLAMDAIGLTPLAAKAAIEMKLDPPNPVAPAAADQATVQPPRIIEIPPQPAAGP